MSKKKRSHKKAPSSPGITISYYAILYMDVLNQREKLSKIDKLPETDEEAKHFIDMLKDTYGVIDGFERLFESYLSQTRSLKAPLNIPEVYREGLKRAFGSRIGKTLFSDSMLYYVSLNEETGAIPTIRVLDLMFAASCVLAGALAAGHPSRGGLDVGIAATFPRVGIYGPGLYKAYSLESQVAQHPRIVIGSELLNYLNSSAQTPGQDKESALKRTFAQKCLSLIYIDTDGASALDYAGKAVRELHPDWKEVISEAVQYAQVEWERFKKEGDHKLAARYFCLLRYLIDRQKKYWT
jgi:hypothetical protein